MAPVSHHGVGWARSTLTYLCALLPHGLLGKPCWKPDSRRPHGCGSHGGSQDGEGREWSRLGGEKIELHLVLQTGTLRLKRTDEMIWSESGLRALEPFKVVCRPNAIVAMKALRDVRLVAWVSQLTWLGVRFLIMSSLAVMFLLSCEIVISSLGICVSYVIPSEPTRGRQVVTVSAFYKQAR